ncbi:hypothetical protein [Paenibacillus sp. SYP-B3998]|nr:hypothetical protein [Paenibacillus sp. SYP-B3998]
MLKQGEELGMSAIAVIQTLACFTLRFQSVKNKKIVVGFVLIYELKMLI